MKAEDRSMTRDKEKFLFDMLDSCRFLLGFVENQTLNRYQTDRPFRSAIERELQIIAEALWQLNGIDPETASQVSEHRRIIGFRHVLVHGYDSLEPETVWGVLTDKLPLLKSELERLLGE